MGAGGPTELGDSAGPLPVARAEWSGVVPRESSGWPVASTCGPG
jgi:hypothetical protein